MPHNHGHYPLAVPMSRGKSKARRPAVKAGGVVISDTAITHIIAGLIGYGLAKLGAPPDVAFASANRIMAASMKKAEQEVEDAEDEMDYHLGLS